MPREFEAKFLHVDIIAMKKKLLSVGAKQVHKPTIYHRLQYKHCKGENGFIRIRKEGEKTTMTTKIFNKDKKFPDEYEVTISESYEKGVKFLESIGLEKMSEQETMREKWSHPLAHEITFDIVPGLPIYMEVDCTSEEKLDKLVSLLGLDKKDMQYGTFDRVFTEYYGIPNKKIIHETPSLSFKNIKREIHPEKNENLFKKISSWNKTIKEDEMEKVYDRYDIEIYKPFYGSSSISTRKQSQKAGRIRKSKKTRSRRDSK